MSHILLAMILAQTPAPSEPVSVDAAIKAFQLPPGFKIELAAFDPQIQRPVAMALDADGRMSVVRAMATASTSSPRSFRSFGRSSRAM